MSITIRLSIISVGATVDGFLPLIPGVPEAPDELGGQSLPQLPP